MATIPKKFEFKIQTLPGILAGWEAETDDLITLYDERCRGLVLRRNRSGWSFGIQKKVRGRLYRHSLQPMPTNIKDLNLKTLRDQTTVLIGDMAAGRWDTETATRDGSRDSLLKMRLIDAVDLHCDESSVRDTTRSSYVQAAKHFAPNWANRKITSISHRDVSTAFTRCSDTKSPATATAYLKALKAAAATWLLQFDPRRR